MSYTAEQMRAYAKAAIAANLARLRLRSESVLAHRAAARAYIAAAIRALQPERGDGS